MNTATAAVLSSFALGVGGVAAYLTFGPSADPHVRAEGTAVEREGDSALAADVRSLRDSVAAIERQIAALENAPRRAAGGLDPAVIEAAVRAVLEERGEAPASAPRADLANVELGSAEDVVALLQEAGTIESTELWKRIVEEGLEDEILALFRAEAEANPNDPEAQLALGEAYLGLTQQAGSSPLAGKYATLADEALDKALAADPQHWEARFTKATALSFWPPVFGKQGAAIQQFEVLIDQQKGIAPSAEHANTHLLLGNMYQQTGQMEKALQAWQSGLELFPGNAELAAQIALAGGGGY